MFLHAINLIGEVLIFRCKANKTGGGRSSRKHLKL